MTIGVGMRCKGGVIVAADTKVVLTDGSTKQANKVLAFETPSGLFAFANATNDGNAATTLSRRLKQILDITTIDSWGLLEQIITGEMTDWARAFNSNPDAQLVLGCYLKDHGVRMYFCEPPNTILPKVDYLAVGAGSAVTDPLQKTLFGRESHMAIYIDPQLTLRHMCYLIARAKEDSAYCGGRTTAVYIRSDGVGPEWINALDLEEGEKSVHQIDFFLSAAAQFLIYSDPMNIDSNASGLGRMMHNLWESVRSKEFHNIDGDLISPPPAPPGGLVNE